MVNHSVMSCEIKMPQLDGSYVPKIIVEYGAQIGGHSIMLCATRVVVAYDLQLRA